MTRTSTTTPLAVAADYADALMTARRAKSVLFLLLLLLILAQLAVFFLAKYDVLKLGDTVSVATATTQPTATQPIETHNGSVTVGQIVRYATPIIDFAGIALSIVLAIVLMLLVAIMLVGRLIGVSHVTGAFIWAIVLIVVLFPWQTFLISDDSYPVTGASASVVEQPAFKWPGALYTWAELKRDNKFSNDPILPAVWMWGRYAGLPVLALLLLLLVQGKSSRGLRFALGEAEVHVEVTTRTDTIGLQ
jgi:hypothetical protein